MGRPLITTSLAQNRNFSLLWLAQVVTTLADVLYDVGVMVVIFAQTGSALQTAGVMVARTLPPFLLGPFAGVLVDRYSRQRVLMAMNLFRAGLVGLLLLLVQGQTIQVVGIYIVVAGLAVAGTFYEPARIAILPSIVSNDQLVRANSLMMSTKQAALAAGYALGGLLILRLGFQTLVLLTLAGFLVAAGAVTLMAVPKRTADESLPFRHVSLGRDVLDGLVYLRDHALARPLVTLEVFEHIPHGIWTAPLMLVFTQQALAAGPEGWGYQNAAFYGGQLLGATIAAVLAGQMARRPGQIIIWNAFLFSLMTIAYAFSPTLGLTIILALLFGLPSAMRDVAQDSLLQASVSADMLGRVFATRSMLANLNFMLAGLAFAWLADQLPIRWVYFLAGLLYLGTALYALASPAIRRSRITAPNPQKHQQPA